MEKIQSFIITKLSNEIGNEHEGRKLDRRSQEVYAIAL